MNNFEKKQSKICICFGYFDFTLLINLVLGTLQLSSNHWPTQNAYCILYTN